MARVVVIGIPGEQGLWMVDLDNGTVASVDQGLCQELEGAAESAQGSLIKGVKVAVAISTGEDVAGGLFER